jgi:hypothetical protein
VVATFRENDRRNPTLDADGRLSWTLARQYRAYTKEDPKAVQEKALPICIIELLALKKETESQRAISQLTIGAFFFACRSCKYLKVPKQDQHQTKQLTLGNIAFSKDGNIIHHSNPNLHLADSVSLTFESQKNDEKNETVTQWTTEQILLCPVKQWAAIVKRISSYPGSSTRTKVSAVLVHGRISHITQKQVNDALRDGVKSYGESKLQILVSEVGTHSLRSGSAMAMYLGGIPVYAIQLIGRWKSDSFMKYLRKQIEQFTLGISTKMLTMQVFRHVPSHTSSNPGVQEYGMTASLMLGGDKNGRRHLSRPEGAGRGETIF